MCEKKCTVYAHRAIEMEASAQTAHKQYQPSSLCTLCTHSGSVDKTFPALFISSRICPQHYMYAGLCFYVFNTIVPMGDVFVCPDLNYPKHFLKYNFMK